MPERVRIKKASRLSVVISTVFHALLIGALAFFAAKEGMLGKEMKKIAVTMVAKEKSPEKPKEKPPEPKPQPEPEKPKQDLAQAPRLASLPPPQEMTSRPSTPSVDVPVAAPPAAEAPSFDFAGGKEVQTTSNPADIYKSYIEYTLRSHWDRPENMDDDHFVAEIALNVAPDGSITSTEWEKGSGNPAWDASVKKAISETSSIGRPPPKGFPPRVIVRFDVLTAASESTIQ